MRLSPIVSAPLAVLVVIGWFLWPFPAAMNDPVGSAMAAVRAVALWVVVFGATNSAASYLRAARSLLARCAVGFAIAFLIVGGISLGLALSVTPGESHFALRALVIGSAVDAFWCTLALALYFLLTVQSSWKRE
jgi:hypothetical protein